MGEITSVVGHLTEYEHCGVEWGKALWDVLSVDAVVNWIYGHRSSWAEIVY